MIHREISGWLIALVVCQIPASGSAAPSIIVVMTPLVSLWGLTHVVTGSVDSFYLVAIGELGWGGYINQLFVAMLLGNLFSGIALVSVLNHGLVAPEVSNKRSDRRDDPHCRFPDQARKAA